MSEEAKVVPAKKKSRLKLVLLLVVIVVLLGGGGAGAFWWMSRNNTPPAGAAHAAPAEHDDAHAAAVSLPTFTVNLAGADGSRYLRTTMVLVMPDAKAAAEFTGEEHGGGGNVKLMKARSAILELLSTQTAEALSTPEGKEALKKAIAEHASKAFKSKVTDVLFSEFVVQY